MEYLTHEQRKADYSFEGEYFKFESARDLSRPIRVKYLTSDIIFLSTSEAKNLLLTDVAMFIGMWMIETYPRLNGFSGLDLITFDTSNL